MPTDDFGDFRPPGHAMPRPAARRRAGPWLLGLLLLVVLGAALWAWWSFKGSQQAQAPAPAAAPPAATATLPPQEIVEPAVRYPLQEEASPPPADVTQALSELLGRKAALTLLQTTDFPRRFVATVDSLGRESSPPRIWPVVPPAGRFEVDRRGDGAVIASANAARYTPLVSLAGSVDAPQVAALYRSLYPQLQAAYEELGYKGRYFNDRMVQVLDLLLAAPEPQGPIEVQRVEVKGPTADPRPWVRWEFADPRLESLPAGQKIMVRMGPDNERRAKQAIASLRAELAAGQRQAR